MEEASIICSGCSFPLIWTLAAGRPLGATPVCGVFAPTRSASTTKHLHLPSRQSYSASETPAVLSLFFCPGTAPQPRLTSGQCPITRYARRRPGRRILHSRPCLSPAPSSPVLSLCAPSSSSCPSLHCPRGLKTVELGGWGRPGPSGQRAHLRTRRVVRTCRDTAPTRQHHEVSSASF
ncbi:hypothetical protein IWX90DRAFT_247236 [Phyllosticta citrichinensis]|uniref:Uncharacterized protein n=1 Tax=Phyllosticta citrichinensis TaxID=1130410 RepID=A0ABR1XRA1_9PEZI